MMGLNDNEPVGVTIPRGQAAALAAAGDVVSQLWGDLSALDVITLDQFNERLEAAGLVKTFAGVPMLDHDLCNGVIDVSVTLARADGDEVDVGSFEVEAMAPG